MFPLSQPGPSRGYGQQGLYFGAQVYAQQVIPYQQPSGYGGYPAQELQYLQAEEHLHRQNEHRAEMGARGVVAFPAYEKHKEKVDLAHAQRHHVVEDPEANKIHKQECHVGDGQHHGQHHVQHHGHYC